MTSTKTKKPSPKTIRPTRPNAGVEAWYRRKLDNLITEMNDSVVYWLKANYRASGAMAMDASPAVFMRDAMKKLAKRWQKRFDDVAAKLAQRFAGDAMKNSDVSLYNALETAGFTVPFKMTPAMNNALQATITESVNLITSIPEQYLTQVQTLVMQSVSLGRDLSTLTDELQKRYGITRRRAALIARDQNNKATAVMQTARQRSIGIKKGIWRHSKAGKHPRHSHVKADGEEFDLSKGLFLDGKWVLPGEEIECKCTWSPMIPGLS